MKIFDEIINEVREENTFLENYNISYSKKIDKNKNDLLFFLSISPNNIVKLEEYNVMSKKVKKYYAYTFYIKNIVNNIHIEDIKYTQYNQIEFKYIHGNNISKATIVS